MVTSSGTYLAAPTVGNGLAAFKNRHFKIDGDVGKISSKGLKHIDRAASMLRRHLLQCACDDGRVKEVFDHMATRPEVMKSGKWTLTISRGIAQRGCEHHSQAPRLHEAEREAERGVGEKEA